jgi:hypothetical protein
LLCIADDTPRHYGLEMVFWILRRV